MYYITENDYLRRHLSHIKTHLKIKDDNWRKRINDHIEAIQIIRANLIESFFIAARDLTNE